MIIKQYMQTWLFFIQKHLFYDGEFIILVKKCLFVFAWDVNTSACWSWTPYFLFLVCDWSNLHSFLNTRQWLDSRLHKRLCKAAALKLCKDRKKAAYKTEIKHHFQAFESSYWLETLGAQVSSIIQHI